MAAIIEQHHDEKGIIWPVSVAPYHVIITLVKPQDEAQATVAEQIYQELTARGVDVLLDDRNERPGVKFNDADLLGMPIRITVGKRAAEGVVEYKLRREEEKEDLTVEEAIARADALVKAEIRGI